VKQNTTMASRTPRRAASRLIRSVGVVLFFVFMQIVMASALQGSCTVDAGEWE